MISKRLGEIILRTNNMDAMIAFYRDVIGLELYRQLGASYFFKIADDLPGHPQVIGLFETNVPANGVGMAPFAGHAVNQSPVHHFAFVVERTDFDREQQRLTNLGYELRTTTHPAMQWRSLYVYDPDGNTVEFVCYDTTIEPEPPTS